ncbi:S8 family serine peptidase [Kitasatospora sp. NPDC049285]|uniref:S8 family serine peptidase n=1 Tax=Kitasatospora sp. NPDC049285 TaxID=3157096 RepID=UPI003424FD19
MTTSRSVRGLAALAAGALVWGMSAGPASADQIRDGQWVLQNYAVDSRVWPVSQGENVTVAVIDSGVAEHQDLAGQVVQGAEFPSGGDPRVDTIDHGTGIAVDIAGRGHGDHAGIIGLAPKAKIMPLKVNTQSGEKEGSFDANAVAAAIRYAVDHGAKVVNMSFAGTDGTNKNLRETVNYAIQKDVVLVAASGNDGDQPNVKIGYPAAFPGVVVVGAIDRNGDLWPRSVTGDQVTLVAPGVDIYTVSSKSTSSYAVANGTSDSAAYVSAIAALVRSKYPNLSAGQVINRMIKSAAQPEGKGPFPNSKFGYGIASPGSSLAANPAVDNGPKENPLLARAESPGSGATQGASSSATAGTGNPAPSSGTSNGASSSSSSSVTVIAVVGGVLALVVVVVIIVLIRRSRNRNGGGPNPPGGGAQGPGYGGGYPPQQAQQVYGQPQGGGYPQQQPYPQQQYPPQAPPAGGNPYQH